MTSSSPSHVVDATKFTEMDPRFKHCGLHIRWVALVASLLQILAISFEVASAYYYKTAEQIGRDDQVYTAEPSRLVQSSLWTVALWSALYLSCMASAVYGVVRMSPLWLIPQMVAQGMTIVVASLESFLLMANLHNAHIHVRVSVLLCIAVAVTCLEVYCLWIGMRCYWYLRDASRYRRSLTASAGNLRIAKDEPISPPDSPTAKNDNYGSQVCLLESFDTKDSMD